MKIIVFDRPLNSVFVRNHLSIGKSLIKFVLKHYWILNTDFVPTKRIIQLKMQRETIFSEMVTLQRILSHKKKL